MQVLAPGEAIYRSIPVGIGINGWDLSEPGHYIVKAGMEIEDQMYLSNDLMIRIAPPVSYEQEYLAQDYFTEEVARILYFEGSRYLQRANDTLQEVTSKFSTQNVARYTRLALTKPHMKSYKKLVIPPEAGGQATSAAEAGGWVDETKPNPDLVRKEMAKVLLKDQQEAATTFGHLTYEQKMVEYGEFLSEQGDMKEATEVLSTLHKTMSKDKVVDSAIDRIERIMNVYEKKATTTKTTRRTRRNKKETVK
ncbi:MAG: hypothetical protein OEM26_21370 [Saprospiraceae bacterium]|nr:hypothetical protein [Saprospiraceae bacterium]